MARNIKLTDKAIPTAHNKRTGEDIPILTPDGKLLLAFGDAGTSLYHTPCDVVASLVEAMLEVGCVGAWVCTDGGVGDGALFLERRGSVTGEVYVKNGKWTRDAAEARLIKGGLAVDADFRVTRTPPAKGGFYTTLARVPKTSALAILHAIRGGRAPVVGPRVNGGTDTIPAISDAMTPPATPPADAPAIASVVVPAEGKAGAKGKGKLAHAG